MDRGGPHQNEDAMEEMDVMSKGVKGLWDDDEQERIRKLADQRRQATAMSQGNCRACDHSRKKREGNAEYPKIYKGKSFFFCSRMEGACPANANAIEPE